MKKNKTNINLINVILSLSLTVLILIGSTYAWFSSNNKANNNDLQMQIDSDSLLALPMTTFWSYLNDEIVVYEKSVGANVHLPTYDSVFEELNDRCRLYIRVPVFGKRIVDGDPFSITLSLRNMDEGKGYTGSEENKNLYEYNEGKNAYQVYDEESGDSLSVVALYLSNVVNIKCSLIPSLNEIDDSVENAEEIYEKAFEFFNDYDTTDNFLDVETKEKTDVMEFDFSNYNSSRYLVDSEENAYVLYIYFEISYNPDLISNLMEHHELELGSNEFLIQSDFDKFVLADL